MSKELQKLKNQKREILEQIDRLYNECQKRKEYREALDIGDEEISSKLRNEMMQIIDEIYKRQHIVYEIENKIKLNTPPVKVGTLVDLRITDNQSQFAIYLHGKSIEIGKIEYRGYHWNEYLGDIGYDIDEEYRNHGYATEALSLLSEKLYEEGINDFWISVYDNNTSSIRVIEKNDGKLLKKEGCVFLYVVPTKLRDISKNSEYIVK